MCCGPPGAQSGLVCMSWQYKCVGSVMMQSLVVCNAQWKSQQQEMQRSKVSIMLCRVQVSVIIQSTGLICTQNRQQRSVVCKTEYSGACSGGKSLQIMRFFFFVPILKTLLLFHAVNLIMCSPNLSLTLANNRKNLSRQLGLPCRRQLQLQLIFFQVEIIQLLWKS